MYVVKNKEGYMMTLLSSPVRPPYTACFNERVTIELAEKYPTEELAYHDIVWLIRDMDEPAAKFEGCMVEKINES